MGTHVTIAPPVIAFHDGEEVLTLRMLDGLEVHVRVGLADEGAYLQLVPGADVHLRGEMPGLYFVDHSPASE